MAEQDRKAEENKPAALRSAAVEALQNEACQDDPNAFDRPIRHALVLIERAGRIRCGRRRTHPESGLVDRERIISGSSTITHRPIMMTFCRLLFGCAILFAIAGCIVVGIMIGQFD